MGDGVAALGVAGGPGLTVRAMGRLEVAALNATPGDWVEGEGWALAPGIGALMTSRSSASCSLMVRVAGTSGSGAAADRATKM